MKYHLPVALALVLAFSGCSTLAQIGAVAAPSGSVTSVAPAAMNAAKKGLIAAHALHTATAEGLTIAAESGTIRGANAVTAKVWLDKSESYLIAADGLVKLGDAPGITAKIAAATSLMSEVNAAIGSK